MARQRALRFLLCILGLFLLGTVIVLSTVSYYLAIDDYVYLTESEVPVTDNITRWNPAEHGKIERIPRIIHQTWKTVDLPPRWKAHSLACRAMMPDYKYMLWTDAGSRDFIADHYPWFLDHFDGYNYAIQRADAIRYFVLHHYGGVYMDLDVGCVRPLDPLLIHSVVLPKTVPVGVSNDLMLVEKGHPFLAQTIHNLITFDHSWWLNYPTVMFSTGPMFLSAQYGLYTSFKPYTPATRGRDIRILPKSLYGKNVTPEEAPNTFFRHYYGSSWHSDDAAFIGFLGKRGKLLMWLGLGVLIAGAARLSTKTRRRRRSLRKLVGYDVLLAGWSHGPSWQVDLRWPTYFEVSSPTLSDSSSNSSPDSERSSMSLLPLSYDTRSNTRSNSPALSDISGFSSMTNSVEDLSRSHVRPMLDTKSHIRTHPAASNSNNASLRPNSHRRRRPPPIVFLVPTLYSHSSDMEDLTDVESRPTSPAPPAYEVSSYGHSSASGLPYTQPEDIGLPSSINRASPYNSASSSHRRNRGGSYPDSTIEKHNLRPP